jgi:hypothetical protein
MGTRGRKYSLAKLIDHIEHKMEHSTKYYQPYQIWAFSSGREFLNYLGSELIKNSLIRLYGVEGYNKIIHWFSPRVDEYTVIMRKN